MRMKIALIIFLLRVVVGGGLAALIFAGVVKVPGIKPRGAKTVTRRPAPKPAPTPPHASPPSVSLARPSQSKPTVPAKQPAEKDPETEKNLARMASVYEQMSAEEASAIFQELPDTLVTQLFRK